MSDFLNKLVGLCQKKAPRLVYPEGADPRILRTVDIFLKEESFSEITLLGNRETIEASACELGLKRTLSSSRLRFGPDKDLGALATTLNKKLKDKGRKELEGEALLAACGSPLNQGMFLVETGQCDTIVAGAQFTTPEVIRAGLTFIGMKPGVHKISSCFLLEARQQPHFSGLDFMIFADCGVIIEPSAEDLVGIASEATNLWQSLMAEAPRVAFLSFSSKGSAKHESVNKMSQAALQFQSLHPEVSADGELQFDAALLPEITAKKAPNSPLRGSANIYIFPDLNAGNIAYKIAQRLGGYHAYGPILQGFRIPLSDLSRGSTDQDIRLCTYVSSLRL